jgi:hypothetical protein
MAKAERGAKSQAIQKYLAANPTSGPRQIVDALKQQGVDVSFGLASAVKYRKPKTTRVKSAKGRKVGRRRVARTLMVRAAARSTSSAGVTVEQLLEVKRFADSLGGPDQLRQALDTLEQLR